MNTRAEARIDELGLGGFPTTFFDAGYGEVVGGTVLGGDVLGAAVVGAKVVGEGVVICTSMY